MAHQQEATSFWRDGHHYSPAPGYHWSPPVARKRKFRVGGYRRRVRRRRGGPRARLCTLPAEKKFIDAVWASVAISTTWTSPASDLGQSLVLIPQGVTEITRVGRKCCVHNVNFRGAIHQAAGTVSTGGHNLVRIMLVHDSQANGANATMTDIYENSTTGIHSYRNLANQGRFRVMWATQFMFNAPLAGLDATLQQPAQIKAFGFSKKCEIPIEYDGTAGAIGEIQSNNLFLTICAHQTTSALTISGRCRVRFVDS